MMDVTYFIFFLCISDLSKCISEDGLRITIINLCFRRVPGIRETLQEVKLRALEE